MNSKKAKAIRRAVRTMMPDAPTRQHAIEQLQRSPAKARFMGRHASRIVLHPNCQKSKVKALKRSLS